MSVAFLMYLQNANLMALLYSYRLLLLKRMLQAYTMVALLPLLHPILVYRQPFYFITSRTILQALEPTQAVHIQWILMSGIPHLELMIQPSNRILCIFA